MHHWHWHFNSLMNNNSSPGNSINYQFDVDLMLKEHTTTFRQSDLISTMIFHTNRLESMMRWEDCCLPRRGDDDSHIVTGQGHRTSISHNNRTHSNQLGTQAGGKDVINWTMWRGEIRKVLRSYINISIDFIQIFWAWETICHNPGLQGRNK